MTGLPASIEAYLQEGGFTGTELLVLKKLLEGHAMTLRELAGKTGKSTGVLDQATKKLIQRKILTKETINDTPKYVLKSLDAIQDWMQRDMEAKRKLMERKAQDFESFVSSLKMDRDRPEMEHFEGEEGIKKAYMKLLSLAEKELLQYVPVSCKEEEDPLRAFRVQLFRHRRKEGIFSRVIVPDTALGKRYRSRDAFEYRETSVIPEGEFPASFEKIIAGDTMACFNHAEKRACFVHYADLVHTERNMFEMLWSRGQREEEIMNETGERKPAISFETKTLSALREFFLSRKSVAVFFGCAVLAVAVTYGLYRQNVYLNTQRVRERVMAIAATAAPEFDAQDLDQLHTWRDAEKPVYEKVVKQLQDVRDRNEGVVYAYVLRPTDDPYFLEFIADAESLDIRADIDLNDDGLRNDMIAPGYTFFDPDGDTGPFFKVANMLVITADEQPYEDLWGTWITGHAPIIREDGSLAAVFGVDVDANAIQALTNESFVLALYFLGFFLLFVFIRLAAFNRSLFKDLLRVFRSKTVLVPLLTITVVALAVTYGMYRYTLELMKDEVGQRLMSVAVTASRDIDAEKLEKLRIFKDIYSEDYQNINKYLNEVRDINENVSYIYILRPTDIENIWEFVVDADSTEENLYIDFNGDGVIDDADEPAVPGTRYDVASQTIAKYGMQRPLYEDEIVLDQWGAFVTASAPILDANGNAKAVLALDMDISDFYTLVRNKYIPYFWFFGTFIALVGSWILLSIIWFRGSKTPATKLV